MTSTENQQQVISKETKEVVLVEIEMTPRLFKQTVGGMAKMGEKLNLLTAFRLTKNGMRGQISIQGDGSWFDVDLPSSAFLKYNYNTDKEDLQFAIKSDELNAIMSRIPKDSKKPNEQNAITFKVVNEVSVTVVESGGEYKTTEDIITSSFVMSFAGKSYPMAVREPEHKNIDLISFESEAKVMAPFEDLLNVIDDMVLATEFHVVRIAALPDNKVEIKQLDVSPEKEYYRATKGGDDNTWSVTGQGVARITHKKLKTLKQLIGDNVVLEFGPQKFKQYSYDTKEWREGSSDKTAALVVTFDEGYVRMTLMGTQNQQ